MTDAPTKPGFYVDAGDLSSVPHTYTASPLLLACDQHSFNPGFSHLILVVCEFQQASAEAVMALCHCSTGFPSVRPLQGSDHSAAGGPFVLLVCPSVFLLSSSELPVAEFTGRRELWV